ncbi:hypothetical protein Bbelb_339830 [Branchiostoma belcheri]|nr:hypothetical protein Bbelb_339830 [Branchiostoma belcheri]
MSPLRVLQNGNTCSMHEITLPVTRLTSDRANCARSRERTNNIWQLSAASDASFTFRNDGMAGFEPKTSGFRIKHPAVTPHDFCSSCDYINQAAHSQLLRNRTFPALEPGTHKKDAISLLAPSKYLALS